MNATEPGLHLILFFQLENANDRASEARYDGLTRALERILPKNSPYVAVNDDSVPKDVVAATQQFLEQRRLNDLPKAGTLRLAAANITNSSGTQRHQCTLRLLIHADLAVLLWSVSPSADVSANVSILDWDEMIVTFAAADPECSRALNLWKDSHGLRATPGLYGGARILEVVIDVGQRQVNEALASALSTIAPDQHVVGSTPCPLGTDRIACRRRRNVESISMAGSDLASSTFFDDWVIVRDTERSGQREWLTDFLVYGRLNEIPPIPSYLLSVMKCRFHEHQVIERMSQLRTTWTKFSTKASELSPRIDEGLLLDLAKLLSLHGSDAENQAKSRETIRLASLDSENVRSWMQQTDPPKDSLFYADRQVTNRASIQAEASYEYARSENRQMASAIDLLRAHVEWQRKEIESQNQERHERFTHRIHLLEVFIVGFYVLYLAHLLGEWRSDSLPYHLRIVALAAIPVIAGAIVVLYMNRPERHPSGHREPPSRHRVSWEILVWVLILVAIASVIALLLPPSQQEQGHGRGATNGPTAAKP